MKSQYTVDVDQKIVFTAYSGNISVDDVIAKTTAVLADPNYRPGMGAVCDYSNASVEWSLAEVDRFRVFMTKVGKQAGQSKWAIVFPKGKDTTTARIFVALHNAFETGIEVQLFRDQHSALAWLKAKTSSSTPSNERHA